jgi:putative transposase
MRAARSPGTSRPYPLTLICQVWRMARSSVYASAAPPGVPLVPGKRGPKTLVTDPDLVAAIRRVLSETPFHGEGYRKVRARLAHRGVPSAASASCG